MPLSIVQSPLERMFEKLGRIELLIFCRVYKFHVSLQGRTRVKER